MQAGGEQAGGGSGASAGPSDPYAPDCARCAALCCVALAFDKGPSFAADKPAGSPCPRLVGHACAIHDRLADKGYSGCMRYDCLGAGQRVTQDLFAGRSWRDEPALLAPMMEAFRAQRRVQELRQLLDLAGTLPLDPAQEGARAALRARLSPAEGWTAERLRAFETGELPRAVPAFLRSLRETAIRR